METRTFAASCIVCFLLGVVCGVLILINNPKAISQEATPTDDGLLAGVSQSMGEVVDTLDLEPDTTEITQDVVKTIQPIYYEVYDYREDHWYCLDEDLQDHLREQCQNFGIPEYFDLLQVQLYAESSFREYLVSDTDDHGIAQINATNYEWLHEVLGVDDLDNPYQSITCQVYIMSKYLADYTPEEALSKYNTGTPYPHTDYADRIMALYNDGDGVRVK